MIKFMRPYFEFVPVILWLIAASIQAYAVTLIKEPYLMYASIVIAALSLVCAYYSAKYAVQNYKITKHYDKRLREYTEACREDAEIAAAKREAGYKPKD